MNFDDTSRYSTNKNIFFDAPNSPMRRFGKLLRTIAGSLEQALTSDYQVGFSEQTVEYPLLYQSLEPGVRTILDFGCVENILPMVLCNLGYKVYGLDFQEYPFRHPNFEFILADILAWDAPAGQFDAVVSVSTVEHVGLAYSNAPLAVEGDRIAVRKLYTSLKKNGKLYLTVPAGLPQVRRGYRTYDNSSIQKLVPNIERLRFFVKEGRRGHWHEELDVQRIDRLTYDDYESIYPVEAVAIIEARRK